jgi:hypothetical protein
MDTDTGFFLVQGGVIRGRIGSELDGKTDGKYGGLTRILFIVNPVVMVPALLPSPDLLIYQGGFGKSFRLTGFKMISPMKTTITRENDMIAKRG